LYTSNGEPDCIVLFGTGSASSRGSALLLWRAEKLRSPINQELHNVRFSWKMPRIDFASASFRVRQTPETGAAVFPIHPHRTVMMKPHSRQERVRVSSRAASLPASRVHDARQRLDKVVVRLCSEGFSPEDIANLLSGHVADAMVPPAQPPEMPKSAPANRAALVVDLSAVPLRFSVSAVMTLYHLQNEPGNPARLGETVGVTPAAMTGILDTLQRRGLVKRVPDAQDRRRIDVTLTAEGRKLVRRMVLN